MEKHSFQPPENIQGFEIDRLLGSGGSGDVYLAHKAEDGFTRTVAIKFATTGRFSPYVLNSFKNELKIWKSNKQESKKLQLQRTVQSAI